MKRLPLGIFLLALVLLAACSRQSEAPSIAAQATPGDIFINEIHYDNSGTDEGEAIEVAGPAGTDLTGWSLVLYNGNGGSPYGTASLSGVIACQQGGFGTTVLSFPTNGLQNGAPDGIALVDNGTVVQFLSYEGSFTAVGGPADGMTSTDIGVSEGSSTAIGASLQLTGTGTMYEDFTWSGPTGNTFGSPNTSQTFEGEACGTSSATLVINEIDYDQPSTDSAEFIELKNVSGAAVSLDGYALVLINGSNTTTYDTIDLSGFSLEAGDYFVVCANAATVANCDLDDGPDTNFIQNGAPDAVALVRDGLLIDAVSYEGDTAGYTEGSGVGLVDNPDVANASISRFPDGSDSDQNNADLSLRCATPGATNAAGSSDCSPVAPATPLAIWQVQGSALASPYDGATVVVDGIVVGDFQESSQYNGFYLQEPDGDSDGDPATSDGIFVFEGSSDLDVAVGDFVRVTGVVDEFFGLTEITDTTGIEIVSTGNALPTPAVVTLPVSSLDDFEPFEGMSVTLPQPLVISEYFNYDRFGEIVLSLPPDGLERPFQPTSYVAPGSEANAVAAELALRRITLDDGLGASNPQTNRHPNGDPFGLTNRFRGGDTLTDTVGVLDYRFSLYRIQPTGPATHDEANPRPAAPEPVGGSLRIASLNVLNYFLTLDDGVNDICGPAQDQECRGADNAEEFDRQRAKLLAALVGLDADIVGLIEMENTPGVSPLADIVAGLDDALGAGSYAYIDTGTIGPDPIRVGLIYRPDAVIPFGSHAILDSSFDPRFDDGLNRPALAQSFLDRSSGGVVTVAVNHLKSKGSACDAVGDPNTGDGQGNCNLTRTAAATVLAEWLATDPTGSGQHDALIIGDLNAYDQEDPIAALLSAGYSDLVEGFGGEFAYSYVFDGQFGYLDHALANAPLASQLTGTTVWHINADEPDLLDYDTSFKSDGQDAIYAPDAYRSSDHDPVLVGLALGLDAGTVIATLLDEVAGLESAGVLNKGQARALSRHLEQALAQIEAGHLDGARGILTGFVDQVNDFVADGILSAEQGASLTAKAEALLAGL